MLGKIWSSPSRDSEEPRLLEYDVIGSVNNLYFSTTVNVQKPTQLQIKISDNLKKKKLLYVFELTTKINNTYFVCVAVAFTKTIVYEEEQRSHIEIRK